MLLLHLAHRSRKKVEALAAAAQRLAIVELLGQLHVGKYLE